MRNRKRTIHNSIVLILLFVAILSHQVIYAAVATEQEFLGKWDAKVKIDQLELTGPALELKDSIIAQTKGPTIANFSMLDGSLAFNWGSGQAFTTKVPVTIDGSKLSGSHARTGLGSVNFPDVARTVEGTVRKSAGGIEFSLKERVEFTIIEKHQKYVSVVTYTISNMAGSSPAAMVENNAIDHNEEVEDGTMEENGEQIISVESITIVPKFFRLQIGDQRQINVKVDPPGANVADVVVKSYDSDVIDINAQAVVKGVSAGYSEIVATTRDGKIQAKGRVFVGESSEIVDVVLDNIWSKAKRFIAGQSFQVKVPNGACGVRG